MANTQAIVRGTEADMQAFMSDLVDDLTTIKTYLDEIKADHNATLAKLDADGGVTDTNYAATNPVASTVTLKTKKGV